MALVVKHEFVSGVADGVDATQVQPSHWNAAHTLSGSAAIAQVDGLQAALDAKVSSDSMSAALAAYVTSNSLSAALAAYVSSASLATALGPYLTSASAALSTYVTSASLATALGPYLTSASAALSTYVTSNSLSAALATYVTSNSMSAALATYVTSASASTALATKQGNLLFQDEGVGLSTTGAASIINFVGTGISATISLGVITITSTAGGGEGSVSISTMISVAPVLAPNQLTVAGSATFSGTAVFNVRPNILVGGVQKAFGGAVLLGEISLASAQSIRFSGSWTNICRFSIDLVCKATLGSATASIAIYSDGGTTPFLNGGSLTLSVLYSSIWAIIMDSGGQKSIMAYKNTGVVAPAAFHTLTANAAVINCIQIAAGASITLSSGIAQLWGWYR